jgi:D-amino-acid dehydrogenase
MSKVAIVGGGLVGVSIARRLLELGSQVVLVDAADAGQATAAGAGILPPLDHFVGVPAVLPLLAAARAFYPELVAQLAGEGRSGLAYDVIGALQVAASGEELAQLPALASECEQRRAAGFGHIGAVAVLSAAEARALFPLLGAAVLGAVYCSGAARIDGRRLLAALRGGVLAAGALERSGNASLWLESGRVTGVRVGVENIAADVVVVAGGAWSSRVLEPLGIQPFVRPQRGQLVHLEVPGSGTGRWPLVLGFSHQYLLGFPERRLVVGATREDGVGYDHRNTAGGVSAVLAEAFRLAPALRDASVVEARAGFRPISGDRMPVLGALAAHPNVFVATGHAGYGLELGPYSGKLVAELIAGDASAAAQLAPFSPERPSLVSYATPAE